MVGGGREEGRSEGVKIIIYCCIPSPCGHPLTPTSLTLSPHTHPLTPSLTSLVLDRLDDLRLECRLCLSDPVGVS